MRFAVLFVPGLPPLPVFTAREGGSRDPAIAPMPEYPTSPAAGALSDAGLAKPCQPVACGPRRF